VTSEFVSACLSPDGVQSEHKDVYWFGQERPYVQWFMLLLLHVALHRSAHSRDYKLSREGANHRSLLRGDVCGCLGEVCVCSFLRSFDASIPLDVAPSSSFIVPTGRARVTFVVKR
jgi:hypothetical protein